MIQMRSILDVLEQLQTAAQAALTLTQERRAGGVATDLDGRSSVPGLPSSPPGAT